MSKTGWTDGGDNLLPILDQDTLHRRQDGFGFHKLTNLAIGANPHVIAEITLEPRLPPIPEIRQLPHSRQVRVPRRNLGPQACKHRSQQIAGRGRGHGDRGVEHDDPGESFGVVRGQVDASMPPNEWPTSTTRRSPSASSRPSTSAACSAMV